MLMKVLFAPYFLIKKMQRPLLGQKLPKAQETELEKIWNGRKSSAEDGGNAADLDTSDLIKLAKQLHTAVEIKDRTYHLRPCSACFVGSEAVQALIQLGYAHDVEQAQSLGDMMIGDGLFAHISHNRGLQNRYTFYKFSDSIHESEKDAVSWSHNLAFEMKESVGNVDVKNVDL
jgi:hypothetical protein